MSQINEKSTGYLTVTFRDKTGTAEQPSSATYSIADVDSGTEVRGSTALSPSAGVVTITLNKGDNTLVDGTKQKERRRVVVSAVYGNNDELHHAYLYDVINVPGV